MNIICPTDFSPRAAEGMKVALALAKRLDIPMRLIHAFDATSAAAVFSGSARAMESIARDKLNSLMRGLRDEGAFAVEYLAVEPPRRGVVRLINESIDESIVVMSALGWTADTTRFGLGNVTEAVVAGSKSPVIVVRDPEPLLRWIERGEALDVLVAIDRSESARSAAQWIGKLLGIAPCRVEGVHVTWARSEEYEKAVAADFEENFERAIHHAVPVTVILNAARPADALTGLALRKGMDLLVVGGHEKGGAEQWYQSIPYAVAELAPMSVAVVPATRVRADVLEPAFRNVVVATDLTPVGNRALTYAYSMAHGSTVHLVHVLVPVVATDPVDGGAVELSLPELDRFRQQAREEMQKLVPQWSDDSTVIHVVTGRDVVDEICGVADRVAADLICLALHERGKVSRWLRGSVARRVVERAKRPVLVVCEEPAQARGGDLSTAS